MSHRAAAEATIDALREGGLLERSDEALCAAVLGLAGAIDDDPSTASLWREYLRAINDLRSLSDGGTDAFEAAMAGLFAAAGNSEKPREAESSS